MDSKQAVQEFKKSHSVDQLKKVLSSFKDKKVLVFGDTIIDEYHYTTPKGRATKDPILSVDYINHEVYAGGILAIANHVSNFVNNVTCATLLGDDHKEDMIKSSLSSNVSLHSFVKPGAPTTVKKRYLNKTHNEKLFKVEYMDDLPIKDALEQEVISYLHQNVNEYDIVIVGDFGHGFITENIITELETHAKFLVVNAQTNSANIGFNFVTKYGKPHVVTLDTLELLYAVGNRFMPTSELIQTLADKTSFDRFLVTLSKEGSAYYHKGKLTTFPAFVLRPADTVGAGDAVLSVIALLAHGNHDELIPFIANCVGGIAVLYPGNKFSVDQEKLVSFIESVYEGKTYSLS